MLDFWAHRREPRNRGGLAQGTGALPRFRCPRRRAQKSSTGYPVLDFGPKSQAPDIRCLTFGPAAGSLETGAGLPKEPCSEPAASPPTPPHPLIHRTPPVREQVGQRADGNQPLCPWPASSGKTGSQNKVLSITPANYLKKLCGRTGPGRVQAVGAASPGKQQDDWGMVHLVLWCGLPMCPCL